MPSESDLLTFYSSSSSLSLDPEQSQNLKDTNTVRRRLSAVVVPSCCSACHYALVKPSKVKVITVTATFSHSHHNLKKMLHWNVSTVHDEELVVEPLWDGEIEVSSSHVGHTQSVHLPMTSAFNVNT